MMTTKLKFGEHVVTLEGRQASCPEDSLLEDNISKWIGLLKVGPEHGHAEAYIADQAKKQWGAKIISQKLKKLKNRGENARY